MLPFRFLFIVFLLFFLKLDLVLANDKNEGTMTGGGGGNAVACFDDEAMAQSAVTLEGSFKLDYLSKIKSLKTLDYWEANASGSFFNPLPSESPNEFLKRIITEKWKKISPTFSFKLLEALQLFENAKHVYLYNTTLSEQTKRTQDVGFTKTEIPKSCRLVGVINRIRKSNHLKYPELIFHYNGFLYDKLGFDRIANLKDKNTLDIETEKKLNLAFLHLHEAVYILGSERGDLTSEESRELTRLILSSQLLDEFSALPQSQVGFNFQLFLVRNKLDKFLTFFLDEYDHIGFKSNAYSKKTRMSSWKSYLSKLEFCTASSQLFFSKDELANILDSEDKFKKLNSLNENCLKNRFQISNEEAFLSIASGLALNGTIQSSDIFFSAGFDDTADLRKVCQVISEALKKTLPENKPVFIVSEAESYCRELHRLNGP